MDLDLRLVRYFVAVADELHYGRAAARLFISQPALSKSVRRLEEQLGATLLVRDSRHVSLTPRGERLLEQSRRLLDLAAQMQEESDPTVVRMAHIFELMTSRHVADAFTRARPDITLVEQSMDSVHQLDALLDRQLDVAILRVTPGMLAKHPTGWRRRLLRLEPMLLIGRPGDPPRATASLTERPVEIFADPPGSGLHSALSDYWRDFERASGVELRWLSNPGTFGHCYAAVRRATTSALVLDFDSHAAKYAAEGIPVHRPAELRPFYPWSIAWRDEPPTAAVADFLAVADDTARTLGWKEIPHDTDVPTWVPEHGR